MLSGIIFATFYGISKAMFRKSLVSYSEVYVDSISSSITKMVEEIDRLSMTFLLQNDMLYKLGQEIPEDSPEYVEYYQNVRHSLERVLNVRIDIEGILISDSSGKVITGGPNAAYRDGMNISHEKWYQEFMKSDEMFTVLPLHKTNATEVFSVIRKLRSYEDMKVNGIVRIDMKKRLLDEICSKTRMKQDTVMLFDKNRKMFYSFGNYPEKNVIKMLEENDLSRNRKLSDSSTGRKAECKPVIFSVFRYVYCLFSTSGCSHERFKLFRTYCCFSCSFRWRVRNWPGNWFCKSNEPWCFKGNGRNASGRSRKSRCRDTGGGE